MSTETIECVANRKMGIKRCDLKDLVDREIPNHPDRKLLEIGNPCYQCCDGYNTRCPGYQKKFPEKSPTSC